MKPLLTSYISHLTLLAALCLLPTAHAERAAIPWGNSACVTNDMVVASNAPAWLVAAYKTGGAWDTNVPAWVVSSSDTNPAALHLELDRAVLTNNLRMGLGYVDSSNATLSVDLYNADEVIIASNLCPDVLTGTGCATSRVFNLPLTAYSNAVGILLRRVSGALSVSNTTLYIDEDGDGLDADQEAQLGSSDYSVDSDGDGFSDYDEVFLYHTDPAAAGSYPCATIEGTVHYAGVQPGPIRVLATKVPAAWEAPWFNTLQSTGGYFLVSVPLFGSYTVKAFIDGATGHTNTFWEAQGIHASFTLMSNTSGIDITLVDPDTDNDGLSDWLELQFGTDPAVFNDFARLPFDERFETNTVTVGDLNGQNRWTCAPSNAVKVQADVVYEGSQALEVDGLSGIATAQHLFVSAPTNRVWLEGEVKVRTGRAPTNAFNASAAFYFNSQLKLMAYDGLSSAWLTLTNTPSLASGDWAKLTLILDYGTRQWLVGVNNTLLASGLGFAVPADRFTAFTMAGYRGFLDNLRISTQMPTNLDLDADGLPDAWEFAHFGNLDQTPLDDLDYDGLNNLQEYLAGTDPLNPDTDHDGVPDGVEIVMGGNPLVADAPAGLPFLENFETNTVQKGQIAGQNGWGAFPPTAATVQDTMVYEGQQALQLGAGTGVVVTVGHTITATNSPVFWMDFHMKAIPAQPPLAPTNSSVAFYFNQAGYLVVYDGLQPDGSRWVTFTNIPPVPKSAWVRMTLKLDYSNQTWGVARDARMLADGLGFASPQSAPAAFWMSGQCGVMDQVAITTGMTAHLSFDGDFLPDDWEMAHFGNLGQTDDGDPDHDGLTNLQEYQHGTDPMNPDTDGDGMPDGWEVAHHLNPLVNDAAGDLDGDGLSNLWEYQHGSSPCEADSDHDGMSDLWEVQHGLNRLVPTDAGLDSDGDGLSNLEEFQADTDPHNSDTDGDGMNDGLERQAHSNPLVQDFDGTFTDLVTMNGSAATSWIGTWTCAGTVIYAGERSGSLDYTLPVPSNGPYVLAVQVTQNNSLTVQDSFDLSFSVDGVPSGRQLVKAAYGVNNTALFFLPELAAGFHGIRLRWINTQPNTFLKVNSLTLRSYGGPDTNANGIPDWMDYRSASLANVTTQVESSVVSPICLEGTSVYQDMLDVTASFVPEGQTQQVIAVQHGVGSDWYANVYLSPTNDTSIVVSDRSCGQIRTNTVSWEAINLLDNDYGTNLTLRGGSALQFAGWPEGATEGMVYVTILNASTNAVTNLVAEVGAVIPYRFDQAGSFFVQGLYSNGVVASNGVLPVKVVSGHFNGREAPCVTGQARAWDCPNLDQQANLSYDSQLSVTTSNLPAGGLHFTLLNPSDIPYYMVARLGMGGPVLDSAKISAIQGDHGTYFRVVETFADGSRMTEVRLQLGYVPADVVVNLQIFVGGVTFLDGTLDKTLTAADFDELGVCTYRMLQTAASRTSTCHTTKLYQGGVYIGGN